VVTDISSATAGATLSCNLSDEGIADLDQRLAGLIVTPKIEELTVLLVVARHVAREDAAERLRPERKVKVSVVFLETR
jgi:hypothetical protein